MNENDRQIWEAGFHGYDECPLPMPDGCMSPFLCSEKGSCRALVPVRKPKFCHFEWDDEDGWESHLCKWYADADGHRKKGHVCGTCGATHPVTVTAPAGGNGRGIREGYTGSEAEMKNERRYSHRHCIEDTVLRVLLDRPDATPVNRSVEIAREIIWECRSVVLREMAAQGPANFDPMSVLAFLTEAGEEVRPTSP